jgi:repressor LexA
MPEPLTPIEQKVYHYLLDFLAENTYQPSIREIGKKFRIKSTKTVSDLLQSLARKGFIERDPSRSRGVRLVGFQSVGGVQPVPHYGKIHAGEPALLPEHRSGFLSFDRRFVPSPQTFALQVKGDSMTGRCIADGDYVLVNPATEAQPGDVVAARLGDEATVKTLRREGDTIVLEPAHPAERSITVQPGDDFAILGVVSGVFRSTFDAGVPGMMQPAGEA